MTATLGSDSCSVCCAHAPAAYAMTANPATTPAGPGMGGIIYLACIGLLVLFSPDEVIITINTHPIPFCISLVLRVIHTIHQA